MFRTLLTLLICALLLAPPAAAQAPGCGAPAELLDSGPLSATAGAMATGRLRILAVGSASVLGPGSSAPAAAWPAQLEALLVARRPDLHISLDVQGGRGLTAVDQWAMIESAIRTARPDLVLWQAGATETTRGLDVSDLAETLKTGLARLRSLGIDTILVDLQFSRFLRANADVEPYRAALRLAGAAHEAPVFRRYDIMQAWAEAGTVDVERAPRERRAEAIDKLNACIARALAAFIRDGVQDARR